MLYITRRPGLLPVFVTLLLITGNALAQSMPAWEHLSPAQRDLLVAPIRERWDSNPDTRGRMFQHAKRWGQLTPEQREAAHDGQGRWETMPPDQRQTMRALFQKTRDMTPEQRHALREQWRAMTVEQRRAYLGQNAP